MRFFLILMLLASTLFTQKALADTGCMPLYGGGANCTTGNLSIIKNVVNPATNSDVHDLGINDAKFLPGQTITFHITITNNSSNTISSATVQDILPQFLIFQSGPGNFNANSDRLTFQMGSIGPNQSQTFTIIATVMDASAFPSPHTLCETNQASVKQDSISSVDTSQFCIQPTQNLTAVVITPTPPFASPQIATSPATGANTLFLSLLLPAGLSGYALIHLAKKGVKQND